MEEWRAIVDKVWRDWEDTYPLRPTEIEIERDRERKEANREERNEKLRSKYANVKQSHRDERLKEEAETILSESHLLLSLCLSHSLSSCISPSSTEDSEGEAISGGTGPEGRRSEGGAGGECRRDLRRADPQLRLRNLQAGEGHEDGDGDRAGAGGIGRRDRCLYLLFP